MNERKKWDLLTISLYSSYYLNTFKTLMYRSMYSLIINYVEQNDLKIGTVVKYPRQPSHIYLSISIYIVFKVSKLLKLKFI